METAEQVMNMSVNDYMKFLSKIESNAKLLTEKKFSNVWVHRDIGITELKAFSIKLLTKNNPNDNWVHTIAVTGETFKDCWQLFLDKYKDLIINFIQKTDKLYEDEEDAANKKIKEIKDSLEKLTKDTEDVKKILYLELDNEKF